MTRTFPAGFVWGASTSAFQIEGAADVDGRGPSIWDDFCRVPGAIACGDDGTLGVDHYHRIDDDVALMAELGLRGYRFSVSWSRVQPAGQGPVNQRGLDFYRRLVDSLRAHDIEPLVTLYHFDLPSALQADGGWANRLTVDRFTDYATIIGAALGDSVGGWATLNEPWVTAFMGNLEGVHAPGLRDPAVACAVAHHLLVAHGQATATLRAAGADNVGVVLDLAPISPASDTDDDRAAAQCIDGEHNRWFLDPILEGRYPDDVLAPRAHLLDGLVHDTDLGTIAQPLDFLGVNYYYAAAVAHLDPPREGPGGPWVAAEHVQYVPTSSEHTDMGWPVDPSGLTRLLTRLAADYPNLPPLLVTENGAAYDDPLELDGRIRDRRRIAYLDGHLGALHDSLRAGVDVRGYYLWSLLDNFEWARGYAMRFGIIHVDLETMERTPKDSARWYQEVIARNGIEA